MSAQLQVTGEAKIRDIQGPVVANSGVITALNGAANQYVRGDGTLASFPTSGGGGSSVSYYLNGSVNQGTFGGSTYYQMSKNAIVGSGTNFSTSANGLIAQFITDANDPDVVSIPSGNWNVEFFMSVSASSGSLASFYVEIYKYNGSTFTLLATNVATPEQLTNTTTVDAYFTSVAMPLSSMAITDRLAIRVFANVASKTVTLYTEDNRLCQVVTTFSKGMLSMNNLTDQSQYLATGTSGTNFGIVSSGDTHTFNLPVASATNTGKLSSTDWSTFNGKVPYTGAIANVDLGNFNFDANNISGGAIIAKLNGPASSPFVLKSGSSGYTIGDDAISLISSPNVANTLILASNIGVVTKTALIGLGSLTANRTFTLPDLSGTLALLEGTQTFSGAKTFTENPIINGTGTNSAYTILQSAGTNKWRIGNNYAAGVNTFDIFAYDNTTTPLSINSNGAMTLTANVTTTGAQFVQNGFYLTNANGGALAGYTHMWGRNEGINFGLRNGTGGASFIFPSATSYDYTFPASSGTLALTSNLSAYLPLTGGTLTGALSGTSASFSNNGLFGGSTNAGNAATYTLSVGLAGTNTGGIQLWSPTNSAHYIQFGDSTTAADNYRGYIGYNHATDTLSLGTASADRLTIASTGAATFSSSVSARSGLTGTITAITTNDASGYGVGLGYVSGGYGYVTSQSASSPLVLAIDGGEKMRITTGGNVGIGTSISSPSALLHLAVANASVDGTKGVKITNPAGTTVMLECGVSSDSFVGTTSASDFSIRTGNSPRMTITSGGFIKASNNGTYNNASGAYHEINSNQNHSAILTTFHYGTSPYGIEIYYKNVSPNNTGQNFLYCEDSTAQRFGVRANGGVANYQANDVNLSDERTKKDIIPLESYWNKFKAIEIVKFKYKDQTHDDFNIGVIAQQVEKVAPEFIDINGWDNKPKLDENKNEIVSDEEPLKSVYTSDLHHATIKVLQEAMAKIEQLEERIKQLENK